MQKMMTSSEQSKQQCDNLDLIGPKPSLGGIFNQSTTSSSGALERQMPNKHVHFEMTCQPMDCPGLSTVRTAGVDTDHCPCASARGGTP